MAWVEQWSYMVDDVELNDLEKYHCLVPEIDNIQQRRVITSEVEGDFPVFIRSQPQEGIYTFMIACRGAEDPAIYQARLDEIRTLFDPSSLHTFRVQARGMDNPKTTRIVTESVIPDYRTRTVVVSTVAPKPVLV